METVDHTKNRTIQEVKDLDYPHECKCGQVIRHKTHYQVHHDCDAQ